MVAPASTMMSINPSLHRLDVGFARSGIDHHPCVRGELLAFHDARSDAEIVDPPTGAGAEDRLVDPDVAESSAALRTVERSCGTATSGLDLRHVEVDDAAA